MADTIQSVKWMLEQTCPLREASEWSNPLLHKAQTYGQQKMRIADAFALSRGICVTGATSVSGSEHLLPIFGFDIAQTFAPLGADGLEKMCADCPAHAAQIAVAGCNGWFHLAPGSPDLDEDLRAIVSDLELQSAIEREFLPTRLLWFGLWADSPLSRGAMETLRLLLAEFADRHLDASSRTTEVANFVLALDAALSNDLTLRVELHPPGHTDFGWHSIFAHCPRCKAGAPLDPWKKTRSQTLICEVCDLSYDPSETASREKMKSSRDDYELLLKSMGAEDYRTFAVDYLMDLGAPRAEAQKVVEARISPDPEIAKRREEKIRQSKERGRRVRHWIRTVLIKDLGQPTEGTDKEEVTLSTHWFSADEMKILLDRCQNWKVEVLSIRHESDDEERDELRASTREFGTAEAALADLRAQGCNDRFFIYPDKMPDSIVETNG